MFSQVIKKRILILMVNNWKINPILQISDLVVLIRKFTMMMKLKNFLILHLIDEINIFLKLFVKNDIPNFKNIYIFKN